MPKIIHIVLFVLISFTQPAHAAAASCANEKIKPTHEMMQHAARNAIDRGFMWRISKDGHSSYLYGTIHVAKYEWVFPGPAVTQALRESDTIALELDMQNEEIKSRMATAVARLHAIPLPEPLQKRLRQQAEILCVPYDAIARFSPEFQISTLTMLAGRSAQLDAAYGIDGVLAGIGHNAKKNVLSLEQPEKQLQLLHMKTPQKSLAYLEESLDKLESGSALNMLMRTAALWSDSDYATMSRFEEWCDCLNTEADREMMRRVLDDRNTELAGHIAELHESGQRLFAAVGSLHLFGASGLPAQMESRGYRVERVTFRR